MPFNAEDDVHENCRRHLIKAVREAVQEREKVLSIVQVERVRDDGSIDVMRIRDVITTDAGTIVRID